MKRFKTVDEFIDSETLWKKELSALRKILNKTELVETVKWGHPAYTINGKNVVGIGSFKSYFGIWFFQGVFLKDKSKKLINAQEGRTKGMRQWRMTSAKEIDETLLIEYLEEAIQNQKDGKEVKPAKKPLSIPVELKDAFGKDTKIRDAFGNFGLGDQRDFAEYIAEAKREETRQKRLEKIVPMILAGTGLNDKYKK
ncbi:MAG: YdeI/OmpD-associated family protein [Acidobacteria bacterium]|nr:YdeI/OmpD-associated family protein [Acidobacteriota bacterium]